MALLMRTPGADLAVKNNAGKTAEQLARYSLNTSNINATLTTKFFNKLKLETCSGMATTHLC